MIKLFMFLLILLSIYDIRSYAVPIKYLLAGSLLAIAYVISSGISGNQAWIDLTGSLLPGLVLLIGAKVTGSIGYADGWLLMLIGIFFGFRKGMAAFSLSIFMIGLTAMVLLLLRKGKKNRSLPYIPFLTLAVVVIQMS
jgi:Flp pilus assembly protein protease CpaA